VQDLVGASARRRAAILLLAMLFLAQCQLPVGGWLWPAGVAAAQVATPTAMFGPINPAECTVEPRPADDFLRLPEELPDPAVELMMGTPVAVRTPPSEGTPASPEIVEAVTETARQFVACSNAFDGRRSGALATDDYFFSAFSGPGPDTDDETLASLLGPHPLPPKLWSSLLAVDNVKILPDGRVTAILVTDSGSSLTVFAESEGRYLVDDAFPLPDAKFGAARRLFQIVLSTLLGESPFYGALPGFATPVAAANYQPVECLVEPRPLDELKALAREPLAAPLGRLIWTPAPDVEQPSGGQLADADIVAAITEDIQEQIACANDGDLPRLTALFSDDFLRRGLGGMSELAYEALFTPSPLPETDRTMLLAVEDVRTLPDGRVSATVRTDTGTNQRIFVADGSRYLIDDNFEIWD
jgi:hypothetical protein